MSANLENSAVATGLEKVSFHSNPKDRQCQRMLKHCTQCSMLNTLNTRCSMLNAQHSMLKHRTVALISHASKVMLKILQARLQQYVNHELPDVQAGFRKGRGMRDQIPNIAGSAKKQESSRKTSISALLTMPKPLTVWITINSGKFFKRWEYQTT